MKMRHIIVILTILSSVVSLAQAGLARETWGAKAVHKDTLAVKGEGANLRIVFDLTAIPKGAAVHRAWLRHEKIQQPAQPIRILVVDKVADSGELSAADKPLALLPPRYQ